MSTHVHHHHQNPGALPPTTPIGGFLTLLSVFLIFLLYFICISAGLFLLCGPPILPFLHRHKRLVSLAALAAVAFAVAVEYLGFTKAFYVSLCAALLVRVLLPAFAFLLFTVLGILIGVLACIVDFLYDRPFQRIWTPTQHALQVVLYEIPVAIMVWLMAIVVTLKESPQKLTQDFVGFVFSIISFILALVKFVLQNVLSLAEELVNAI